MVLNFREENQVSEFSWSLQFNHQLFADLRKRGIDLENIVYYRGETHYFVLTPKRKNLLEQKVLKQNFKSTEEILAKNNINKQQLELFVTKIIQFFGIPQYSPLSKIKLFDFSLRKRATKVSCA